MQRCALQEVPIFRKIIQGRGCMMKLKEIAVKSLVTKSALPDADYVINPYTGCPHKCIYCYAAFMKRFTKHTEPWGTFLDVKQCAKNINVKPLANKTVLLSSVTDAYNPYEKHYEVTRSILQQLIYSDAHIEILTKSALVLRDLDLFKKIKNLTVGISLNTLDDSFRKQIEPAASSIHARIAVLKTLALHGIPSYLFISPIFPEITDYKAIINEVGSAVDTCYFENLNLREPYKTSVLNFILREKPALYHLYKDIYMNGETGYWDTLKTEIVQFFTGTDIKYKVYFHHGSVSTAQDTRH